MRIGFIPLCDATALIVAVDKGFTAAEGLDVDLVREVSWSNVRDKLNIGLFDAAHLIAPVAIASSLGLGHVKVPIVAPVRARRERQCHHRVARAIRAHRGSRRRHIIDPLVTARALARVVATRKARGEDPLTFGMTFPFSTHNYHLRFWMAAGGVDPDEDVRLVVLPPPYMVESLANGHVDGFCVGAPWNSVAVDLGIGFILHFVSEILPRAAEKVLAVRRHWADENPDTLRRLVRAHQRAADFVEDVAQSRRGRGDPRGAEPHRCRAGGDPPHPRWPAKVSPDGATRTDARYLLIGRDGAAGPIRRRRRGSMRRWCAGARRRCRTTCAGPRWAVFRPDLYDAAVRSRTRAAATDRHGSTPSPDRRSTRQHRGAPASWRIGRVPVPEMTRCLIFWHCTIIQQSCSLEGSLSARKVICHNRDQSKQ